MADSKSKPNKSSLDYSGKQNEHPSASSQRGRGVRNVGPGIASYDELDYRLMATFPASDATARY